MSIVSIFLTSHGRGRVQVDGKEVADVVSISVQAGVKQKNSVILTLEPQSLEVKADEASVCINKR